ncbi:MAG: EAL domain-containing protein [Methylohalobius sp. ZOD2]
MNTSNFSDNAIIVAEPNSHHRHQIETILSQHDFKQIHSASDGEKLRSLLQQLQKDFSQIGLTILSDQLPDCQLLELCQALADEHSEIKVPIIILRNSSAGDTSRSETLESLKPFGVTLIEKPIRAQDFMPLVQLALVLKKERNRTHLLQEQMLTELAEHKILEARLKYLILHDELTGVGNRRSLEQTLQLAIHHCQAYQQESALLYVDIDRFNIINDIEGHDAGDRLLVEVINLIRQTANGKLSLSRIGADEFCIHLPGADRTSAMETAEAIRQAVDEFRFLTSNDCYHISISIGITLLTSAIPFNHPNELIAQAHQACFVAKNRGRNLVNLYDANDVATTHFNDVRWVPLLRDALKHEQFQLVFQPIIRLQDGLVSHYEVLLRMRGENGKIFSPNIFIPVAERMGLIHNIDMWVIEHAIDFLAQLPADQNHVTFTINLSGHAFQNNRLLPLLEEKLESTWVSPKRLIFEITETAAIANFERTRTMMAKLRSLGCGFALDDFGTGFSSFEYIKNFPADYIKIDGQFIQNLVDDETDQVLVKATVEIAHKLGKQVIAEYIETPKVLELLGHLDVDYAQGFLLGKPHAQLLQLTTLELTDFYPNSSRTDDMPLFGD